ncbi:MAG: response regulator transcription factor [Mariprofundaceae bacterium]|nr:response regulator transcription factor [Mariprofundaceae bacterium]
MHILIADDHGLFRDSMRAWLEQLDKDYLIHPVTCVDEVKTELASDKHYCLVLLDLNMPGMSGVESISDILTCSGDAPIIIVSANENPHTIRACINAGAAGFVPKSSEGDTILAAINIVLAGGSFIPGGMTTDADCPAFSDKQLKILQQIAYGGSNRDIAQALHLSEGTIKQYISEILAKLGVDNRTQAALAARDILGISN